MEGPRGLAGAIFRLMQRFAPRHAEAAERESKEWFYICRECGNARSLWDTGALRYKAASKGKATLLMCPTCGRRRWHSVERRPGAGAASSTSD